MEDAQSQHGRSPTIPSKAAATRLGSAHKSWNQRSVLSSIQWKMPLCQNVGKSLKGGLGLLNEKVCKESNTDGYTLEDKKKWVFKGDVIKEASMQGVEHTCLHLY